MKTLKFKTEKETENKVYELTRKGVEFQITGRTIRIIEERDKLQELLNIAKNRVKELKESNDETSMQFLPFWQKRVEYYYTLDSTLE